jgi:hypothetical protein
MLPSFVIVQCRVCPALMVPVASGSLKEACLQSPEKTIEKPRMEDSVTVKLPGPNVTALVCPLPRVNEDG